MTNKRTVSAIDLAFQIHDTPVGPLFVAQRHGRIKKCFSRDTAIRYLAFFMTTWAFEASGFRERYPDKPVNHPELGMVLERGCTTLNYRDAHRRCISRLRRLLARKREIQKWTEKYDAWVAQRDELMKQKPF